MSGLQVFNEYGQITLDLSDRVMKVLTVQLVAGTNGAIAVPSGNYQVVAQSRATGMSERDKSQATLTLTGDRLSWDYGSVPPASRRNDEIMVSVF